MEPGYWSAGVAAMACCVSIGAVLITRHTWRESNRPIVTAEVVTNEAPSTEDFLTFNLVVHNVGNRPATNIQLHATPEALAQLLEPSAPENYRTEIKNCFSERGKIALLHHGKSVVNGFGLTAAEKRRSSLRYGASIQIAITYEDLSARAFKSELPLIVKDSKWFAGSGWDGQG